MAPGVDSASNRNENQVYFLGGKDGRCVRVTTLPPNCAVVMKSGDLNFLELSGPLQACNGTSLLILQILKLCIVQSPPITCYLIALRLKSFPSTLFSDNPQPCSFITVIKFGAHSKQLAFAFEFLNNAVNL